MEDAQLIHLVPLQPIANQRFASIIQRVRYDITLQYCGGIMAATIDRDGVCVASGSRCVYGRPLAPSSLMEGGNFLFYTENMEIPNYTKFNTTHWLFFVTADQIGTFVADYDR